MQDNVDGKDKISLLPDLQYIVTKVRTRAEVKEAFVKWQAQFHTDMAAFPGFLSLEVRSPHDTQGSEWVFVERFADPEKLTIWHVSEKRKLLFKELEPLLDGKREQALQEVPQETLASKGGVTEVFVTEVSHEMENAFREWIGKIHQVEAAFPGFRSVYVQSPRQGKGKHWITLLQFDTPENLDRWLASKEREEVLQGSGTMMSSLESHRVISPYAGWFSSVSQESFLPSVWKQGMIVLLVLFPVVMLEMKFLLPRLTDLSPSPRIFISNVVSVGLVTWPLVPLAIWFLRWWLTPQGKHPFFWTVFGTFVVMFLYAVEVALLWYLL